MRCPFSTRDYPANAGANTLSDVPIPKLGMHPMFLPRLYVKVNFSMDRVYSRDKKAVPNSEQSHRGYRLGS